MKIITKVLGKDQVEVTMEADKPAPIIVKRSRNEIMAKIKYLNTMISNQPNVLQKLEESLATEQSILKAMDDFAPDVNP